jgi:hypothetical protein
VLPRVPSRRATRLVECRPLEDLPGYARRERSGQDGERLDADGYLLAAVARAGVRGRVIAGVHGDHDAEKAADGGHACESGPLLLAGVTSATGYGAGRSDVRAIENELITRLPGDNSGSHRAGTPAIVQTSPVRITAAQTVSPVLTQTRTGHRRSRMACKRSGVRVSVAPPGHVHISNSQPATCPAPRRHLRGSFAARSSAVGLLTCGGDEDGPAPGAVLGVGDV